MPGALAKPALRGGLAKSITRNVIAAFAFGTVNSVLWWAFVMEPRKQAYRNFYATYDPDKEFERMCKTKIFMGLPSKDKEEEEE